MEKNSRNFSMQEAMKLANSEAGKKFLASLQQADPQLLQSAMAHIRAGDYEAARQLLAGCMTGEGGNG